MSWLTIISSHFSGIYNMGKYREIGVELVRVVQMLNATRFVYVHLMKIEIKGLNTSLKQ